MKTKIFNCLLIITLLAGIAISLTNCGDDDYYADLMETDITHLEDNDYIFNYDLLGYSAIQGKSDAKLFRNDKPVESRFSFHIENADVRERLDGGDVIVDENFMAIFNENGKLIKRIDFDKLQHGYELLYDIKHPNALDIVYSYEWIDSKGQLILPVGKYISQFTLNYNITPGSKTKQMKTITFKNSFEIVESK